MSSQPTDWHFLWKPRWILSHLFVLAMVVLMVNLGFWQLRRLHERRAYNATVESRQDVAAEPVQQLLPSGPASAADEVDAVAYRIVSVTGTYLTDQEVLVQNRTDNSVPGFWVLTPMKLDDGTAVVVNRGWVPFVTTDPKGSWSAFDPPSGQVTVTGMLQAPQVRGSGLVAGPRDASEGQLRTLSRVDVGRLGQQVDESLWPLYVNLQTQQPAQADSTQGLPKPVPPPELSEGPHLNYAGQWFIFSTLTVIVYPLLLRKVARQKGAERASESGPGPDDDSGPTDPPPPRLEASGVP